MGSPKVGKGQGFDKRAHDAAHFPSPPSEGVPPGGTTGEVLTKIDDTSFNMDWEEPHYIPAGGVALQVLQKINNFDYNVQWQDLPDDPDTGGGTTLYFARGLTPTTGVSCTNGNVTQIHDARGGGTGLDLDVAITNVSNIFDGDQITIPSTGEYEIELAGYWNETNTSAGERVVYLDDSNSPGPVIAGDPYLAVSAIGWVATTNQITGMTVRYTGPLPSGLPIFPKVMQQSGATMIWWTRHMIVRKL